MISSTISHKSSGNWTESHSLQLCMFDIAIIASALILSNFSTQILQYVRVSRWKLSFYLTNVAAMWQTIVLLSIVYQLPPLLPSLHCIVSRSWIQARMKEQDGKRWLICQDLALLFYLSACVWMKYWLEAWEGPAATRCRDGWQIPAQISDNNKNRPSSTQYLIKNQKSILNAIIINLVYNY